MHKDNHFTLFHVFTGSKALGNPAVVTQVKSLPDFIEHKAMQPNCDTAVYIKPRQHNEFDICWFSKTGRIQRCGHGTLAAAAYLQKRGEEHISLVFHSDTESLNVALSDTEYSLQLTLEDIISCASQPYPQVLPFSYQRLAYTEHNKGYLIVELQDERAIKDFTLTTTIMNAIEQRALIITASSQQAEFDIIFRYFAPQYGPPEDQATGSAASILWPFWKPQFDDQMHSDTLRCYQASPNGGVLKITSTQHGIGVHGKVSEDLKKNTEN